MSWKNNKKNIICDFLRSQLTDSRSRHTTETFTFTGTGNSQTISFSDYVTNNVYCVNSVSTGGSSIKKWSSYLIDLQNQNITGTFTNGSIYTVSVKTGTTSWIYPGLAKKSLSTNSYPRISLIKIGQEAVRNAPYTGTLDAVYNYQIDVWVKENYTTTFDSVVYSNESLAEYLTNQIINSFKTSINEIYPELYDFQLNSIREMPFDKTRQCFHNIIDFNLRGIIE